MRSRSGTSFVALAILVMLLVPADAVLAGQAQSSNRSALDPASAPPAYRDATQPVTKRVKDLLGRMTLEEKIGQMTQAERGAVADDPSLIAELQPGLGAVGRWLDPDAEHARGLGRHGQRVPGAGAEYAPRHPDHLRHRRRARPRQRLWRHGLPAQHRPRCHRATPSSCGEIGEATAEEVRATGIPWAFAPCVCVARDERWGRTYESFGEDPALVSRMETSSTASRAAGRASISPDHVLATAKHYAGDGDTEYDAAAAAANVGKPWYEQRTRSTRASR